MSKFQINANGKKVLEYVKAHQDENITSGDIALALGMDKRQVDGVITRGLLKRGVDNDIDYVKRVPAVATLEDGSAKNIKLIKATEDGMNYDDEVARQADIEATEVE